MKNKKFYKVVRVIPRFDSGRREDEYYSARASDWTTSISQDISVFSIKYKVGKWTSPKVKGSKLFVFDNLNNAKDFCHDGHDNVLFECEVINPSKPKYICNSVEQVREFWQMKNCRKSIKGLVYDDALPGTTFCDSVRLVKEIK